MQVWGALAIDVPACGSDKDCHIAAGVTPGASSRLTCVALSRALKGKDVAAVSAVKKRHEAKDRGDEDSDERAAPKDEQKTGGKKRSKN